MLAQQRFVLLKYPLCCVRVCDPLHVSCAICACVLTRFVAADMVEQAVAYLLAHGADPMRTLTNDFLVQKARTYSFVAQKLHHERERAKFKAAPLLTAQEKAEAAAAEDELRHQAEIQAAELHLEVAKREFAKQQVSVTFLETHSSLGFRLEEQDALVKDRALSQLFNARIAVS